ncbi:hypothetical protein KW849_18785 [Pseudomonas sp. PDM26]|uniref:hypothetical protein n=1 Tax=Pseudomonas sp. PDM26 TaxID=2854766 RepID=UPI001C48D089|nr:hypothetical protein [Pseudomonas sp. PDM26]MBV7548332.1 hypothetical protein [Pseudomonas sp. PDM26]
MDAGATTLDAFRFLDIRSPKPVGSDPQPAYVVTRDKLRFPLTLLEGKLSELVHDNNYVDALKKAVLTDDGAAGWTASGGYVDHLAEYELRLTDDSSPPEEVRQEIHDLFKKLSKGLSVDDYLSTPASRDWDSFLSSVIAKTMGDADVAPSQLSLLARSLRVAAAIYSVLPVDGTAVVEPEPDIRPLIVSSIYIGRDLFDPKAVRDKWKKVPLKEISSASREMQDELVKEVVKLDLAASELRTTLMGRLAILQLSPAPDPTAEAIAPAAGDVAAGQSAADLVVSLPKTGLSQTTIEMLLTEYGGADKGTNIENIDIVSVLGRLGADLSSKGGRLFRGGSQAAIATFCSQHPLLTRKMAVSGDLPEELLRDLPLLIPAPIFDQPEQKKKPLGASVRPLGVGDLKVVKQNLLRYEAGEVAHVENVLQGQQKERVHSVKQRTEETFTIEQERSTSSERDLQSTDRFEMKEESTAALMEKRQNETGVTMTASYGAVSISANTKFSDVSTSEQSQKLSRSFAREVIDRSVSKVQQRVREERTRKTTLDIEETNRYSLSAQKQNVIGVYRWVDKVYWAQVHVYGKRLMLEFMVPEPATLYVHAQGRGVPDPAAVPPPEPLQISAHHLQRHNYAAIAAKYGAEVSSPPPLARSLKFIGRTDKDTAATNVEIEDGFVGIAGGVSYAGFGPQGAVTRILLGTNLWNSKDANWYVQYFSTGVVGHIPLLVSTNLSSYSASAQVVCVPSDAAFEKWQLDTYKAISATFQVRQSEYEEYLASRSKKETTVPVGSDAVNRDIERRELQRACIEMLSEQHFSALGAIKNNPTSGWPEIDLASATPQGAYAAFFQQSFEWDQITYMFYPYYWSRQSEWGRQINANGGDILFSRFLNAGYARVIVPVRPAHESDILYFLETGQIWGGTEPPVLGDADFVSVIDEIKESLDAPDSGTPEGHPWQFRIPTSLVILDAEGKLPEWPASLPMPEVFIPSKETCGGIPYNLNQWKDGKSKADAVRLLGYELNSKDDQDAVIKSAKGVIRSLQMRFNELGVAALLGRQLKVDGILGPCTLRALTYFVALHKAGKWPGAL